MSKRRKKRQAKNNYKPYFHLAIGIFFVAFIAYLLVNTKYWSKDRKLILTHPLLNGDVEVVVFNPKTDEITAIVIPKTTDVDVSRGLGVWQLGSVWQLGINEGMGGRLLTETVVKNFKIPAFAWLNSAPNSYSDIGMGGLLKALLIPKNTNLKLGDRVRLMLFALSVKEFKKTSIDLNNTNYLKREILKGGEEGYKVTNNFPHKLILVISDIRFAKEDIRVLILDNTGSRGFTGQIGEIIEKMSAKVASVDIGDKKELDCLVISSDRDLAERVGIVFGCEVRKGETKGNFDIELTLGKQFVDRY